MIKHLYFIALIVIVLSQIIITDNSPDEAAIHKKFHQFTRKWGKRYSSEEERAMRYSIFKKNYIQLLEDLKETEDSMALGVTKFFDLAEEEFKKQFLSLETKFLDMMRAEMEFEDFSENPAEWMDNNNSTCHNDTDDGEDKLGPGATAPSDNNSSSAVPTETTSSSVPAADGSGSVTPSESETRNFLGGDDDDEDDDDFESDDPNDDPNDDLPEVPPSTPVPSSGNLRYLQNSGIDWRSKGAVTNVKNQGKCGSCWAFTTIANIEGQYAIKHNKQLQFSEQQLVDCDYSNNACNGGAIVNAMNFVKRVGGVNLMSSYPYRGYKARCKFNSNAKYAKVSGYVSPGMSETAIYNMLVARGPLSAAINANTLYSYRGGILGPSKKCNPYALNHGVTIIGAGTADGTPYWIVKNSWGPNWGEGGYFRIKRGIGACGINRTVYSVKLA